MAMFILFLDNNLYVLLSRFVSSLRLRFISWAAYRCDGATGRATTYLVIQLA